MDEDTNIKAFAARMTTLRMKKGVAARDMSLSLGFSHNYVHNIEAEKNYPNMYNFFIICDYLGISPKDFFTYESGNIIEDNELFREITRLDAKSQAYFLSLIRDVNNRPTSV